MGHLRSVQIAGAPHVNITRVHGLNNPVGLVDAPTGFTNGCHPSSTQYCRNGAVAPQPAPGVDISRFQPRTYGSTAMVPGIAHVPTSIVDRDYGRAQAVLNANGGGIVPHPSMMGGAIAAPIVSMSAPAFTPPAVTSFSPSPVISTPAAIQGPVTVNPASTARFMPETLRADGTYWEQTSGPTMVGGTMATKVICKRQAQVVNPVVGVPHPVPTPVYCQQHGGLHLAGGPNMGHWGH